MTFAKAQKECSRCRHLLW